MMRSAVDLGPKRSGTGRVPWGWAGTEQLRSGNRVAGPWLVRCVTLSRPWTIIAVKNPSAMPA